MPRSSLCALLLLVATICSGCGKEPPKVNRKETIPVKGKVLVDGKPGEQLSIQCITLSGADKTNPTSSTGSIDGEGNLVLSTYEIGDGVPEGEYALRFEWFTRGMSKSQPSVDKFKGRYRDEKNSPAKFTAKKGQPVDLGEIKLTTN